MVGKSVVTFSCCVLLYFSTQIEIAHTPTFTAPLVTNQPHKSPKLSQTGKSDGNLVSPRERRKFNDALAMVLELPPARFISWSHKLKTILGMSLIQQNCLTTGIYFEARSEPVLGQLAVATVILNRAKSSSSSLCGVVYKGANHFNACQFSFACDGKPDVVDDAVAWQEALKTTEL